jgi:hypothetical protein
MPHPSPTLPSSALLVGGLIVAITLVEDGEGGRSVARLVGSSVKSIVVPSRHL